MINQPNQSTFFVNDIDKLTLENNAYRKVLETTEQQQLVIMSLLPNEEIGMEIHPHTTQFIKVVEGDCDAILNGQTFHMKKDFATVIPAGTNHNIINTSNDRKLENSKETRLIIYAFIDEANYNI